MATKFLTHTVDGKVVSRTLCTSHQHANNIWRDLLLKHDPFTRNGQPIRAVYEHGFAYQTTRKP